MGTIVAGWFLLDDEAIELDDPMGWEPLTSDSGLRAPFGRDPGLPQSAQREVFLDALPTLLISEPQHDTGHRGRKLRRPTQA